VVVAVLAFVLMNFLGGGGGSDVDNPPAAVSTSEQSPAPEATERPATDDSSDVQGEPLRSGGRDPFSPR
jgi:hypothetical protein